MRFGEIKAGKRARWAGIGVLVSAFMVPAHAQIDLARILRDSMANGARAPAANPRARAEADRASADAWCNKLGLWLNKTDTVPPEILQLHLGTMGRDRSRDNTAAASDAAKIPRQAWIMDDLRFVPEFGKAFDAVTPQEAERYRQQAGLCRQPAGVYDVTPKLLDVNGFGHMFNGPTQRQMALGVQAIRAARAEAQSALQRFEALPTGEPGAAEYQQLEPRAQRLRFFLGNAERARLDEAMLAANARVVQPLLTARTQETVQDAQGYEGFVSVAKMVRSLEGAGPGVKRPRAQPGDPSDDNLAKLKAKRSALAIDLVRAERLRIDALGSGAVGAERGVDWHRDFRNRYGNHLDVPEIRALEFDFLKARSATLEAALPDLGKRIALTNTEAELRALVAKYLALESDPRDPTGTRLLTKVSEQRDLFDKRRVLGTGFETVAATAPAVPPPPGRTAPVVPATRAPVAEVLAKGEPSESDMYDLIKQRFDDAAKEVRDMADLCRRGPDKNDPAGALMCLMGAGKTAVGGGQPIKITSFEKIECAKASGKPGYVCDYLMALGGGPVSNLGPSFAKIYGSSGSGQGRFLKTRDGWIAYFGEKN